MRRLLGIPDALRKWLNMLPTDTIVDPLTFPEAGFPVRCMGCSYTLTGLPDGRCPECGREFTRGRLLVEQYALYRIPRRGGWYGVVRRCYWVGGVLPGAALLLRIAAATALPGLVDLPVNRVPSFRAVTLAVLSIVAVQFASAVIIVTGGILQSTLLPPRAKRDAVRAALGLPLLRDQWKFRWR